ncbi:MAG: hypothetical protein ACLFUO_05230 [Candidatus Woesearchaeota archaeon]
MRNKIGLLMVFMLAVVMMASSVAADVVPVDVVSIQIDGSYVFDGSTYNVKRGDKIDITIELEANESVDDIEIEASLRGYGHRDRDSLVDVEGPFDMVEGSTYRKRLSLEVPQRVDVRYYDLRIEVYAPEGIVPAAYVKLQVDDDDHNVAIRDVIFSPQNGVLPGRALLSTVRVRNYGEDEEDVKVTVGIPALGVSASDYIDEIEGSEDDTESSEELFLRIPQNAEPGTYKAVVEVEYYDGDETEVEEYEILVLAEDAVEDDDDEPSETTFVSADSEPQTGTVGETLSYPVTISNVGSESKTYAITVSPANWATFQINPTNLVVVEAGSSKTVYLYVTPNEGAEGDKVFIVNVRSGNTMKQVALQANVMPAEEEEETETGGFRRTLEIGAVVLIVFLLILGLVIVFNKLTGPKNDEDEDEDEETQTYY